MGKEKAIYQILVNMKEDKISAKEALMKIEDTLDFDFDEEQHTYQLTKEITLIVRIERKGLLTVYYGDEVFKKSFYEQPQKKRNKNYYSVYWVSPKSAKQHGNFSTVKDAYNSIQKWWDKNDFRPLQIRIWPSKFNEKSKNFDTITIDYGPHNLFYKIKKNDGTDISEDIQSLF